MRNSFLQQAAVVLMALLFVINSTGCSTAENYTQSGFIMDTNVDISFYGISKKQADSIAAKVFAHMQQLENIFSRHISGSDIKLINEHAGCKPVEVEAETIYVLQKALEIAEISGGAFDPTIGPLLELWGFGTEKPRVPSVEEINEVLPLVNYKLVEIDAAESTVFLPQPGMKLDLGGIAKGFIVDQGSKIALQESVKALFINAGGDISISGKKPTGEKWKIAVQDPDDPQKWAAILQIDAGCLATSGDYQRFFEKDGEIFHHILDPKKGTPAGELSSVSIVASDTLTADALSTAVFVLGLERGMELLENLEQVEGVIIDREGKIFVTSGLKDNLEILAAT